MRTVRVEWDGPLTVDEVLELGDRSKDFGLYQIYGRHIIFGLNSLLYVGKTNGTFSERIRSGHVAWLADEESVFIHVGRINKEDYRADRQQVIKDTEALTIHWHSPPYNSSNIDTYNGQVLRIVNVGKCGSLDTEFSSSTLKAWGGDSKGSILLVLKDMEATAVYEIWEKDKKACYLECLAMLSEIRSDSFEKTVLEQFASGQEYPYFSGKRNAPKFSDQIRKTGIYVNGVLTTYQIRDRAKQIAEYFGCKIELIVAEY